MPSGEWMARAHFAVFFKDKDFASWRRNVWAIREQYWTRRIAFVAHVRCWASLTFPVAC
jgi:hypothetical protein